MNMRYRFERGRYTLPLMLIFGTRNKLVDLGETGVEDCPVCERERPFHLQVHYAYHHLNFIIRMVASKQYWKLCSICGRGQQLPAATTEQWLGRNPIPKFDRIGGWIFAGLMLFFVATLTLVALL